VSATGVEKGGEICWVALHVLAFAAQPVNVPAGIVHDCIS
jgi:hypothetical protein